MKKYLVLLLVLLLVSCSTCKPTKIYVYKKIEITCLEPKRPKMLKISGDFFQRMKNVRINILKFKRYILELENYKECVKKQSE